MQPPKLGDVRAAADRRRRPLRLEFLKRDPYTLHPTQYLVQICRIDGPPATNWSNKWITFDVNWLNRWTYRVFTIHTRAAADRRRRPLRRQLLKCEISGLISHNVLNTRF